MSYSILRLERVKTATATNGFQRHNQRENQNYSNQDIKHDETHRNYDLIHGNEKVNYNELIEKRIEDGYTGKRAVRKDAVKHVQGIITSDTAFFENMSDDNIREFFEGSLEFVQEKYGKDNVLYATVHLDEKTPHMHFGFVPLTEDGRLSAKKILGNKNDLSRLQDEFHEYVNNKGYDMERGQSVRETGKKHLSVEDFKKQERKDELTLENERLEKEKRKKEKELAVINEKVREDIKRANQPLNVSLENEVHEEKNVFGKVTSEYQTGRLIMTEDDFTQIKQKYFSATRILEDYERLRYSDFHKENESLKAENKSLKAENVDLMQFKDRYYKKEIEVETLKEENDKEKEFSSKLVKSLTNAYITAKKHIPGFEDGYDRFTERLSSKTHTEHLGAFLNEVKGLAYKQDKMKRREAYFEL